MHVESDPCKSWSSCLITTVWLRPGEWDARKCNWEVSIFLCVLRRGCCWTVVLLVSVRPHKRHKYLSTGATHHNPSSTLSRGQLTCHDIIAQCAYFCACLNPSFFEAEDFLCDVRIPGWGSHRSVRPCDAQPGLPLMLSEVFPPHLLGSFNFLPQSRSAFVHTRKRKSFLLIVFTLGLFSLRGRLFVTAHSFPFCSVSGHYVLPRFSLSAGCPWKKGHFNSCRSKESVIAVNRQAESVLCLSGGDGKEEGRWSW